MIIIPKLYQDLLVGIMDTLNEYMATYKHLPVWCDLTDLEQKLLLFMCKHAAQSIKLQCGREYGFSDPGDELRATDFA